MTKWRRYRFYEAAGCDDYRPIKFPPPGPFWCSGYACMSDGRDKPVIVAYLPPDVDVTEFWPGAHDIDFQEENEITFTDRFAKPDWWEAETE